jgi:hypothetical protein
LKAAVPSEHIQPARFLRKSRLKYPPIQKSKNQQIFSGFQATVAGAKTKI